MSILSVFILPEKLILFRYPNNKLTKDINPKDDNWFNPDDRNSVITINTSKKLLQIKLSLDYILFNSNINSIQTHNIEDDNIISICNKIIEENISKEETIPDGVWILLDYLEEAQISPEVTEEIKKMSASRTEPRPQFHSVGPHNLYKSEERRIPSVAIGKSDVVYWYCCYGWFKEKNKDKKRVKQDICGKGLIAVVEWDNQRVIWWDMFHTALSGPMVYNKTKRNVMSLEDFFVYHDKEIKQNKNKHNYKAWIAVVKKIRELQQGIVTC